MNDQHDQQNEDAAPAERDRTAEARRARRRFLKVTGAAALAVPVIETVTGKDLLTTSAQAQTAGTQGVNGGFTGSVNNLT